jgi:hypothetical protein
MRSISIVVMIVVSGAQAAFTANGTWTGRISDSMCGISHARGPKYEGQETLTDAECIELCLAAGAKYVFVSDGHVYSIANQDNRDLARNIGREVQLTGNMEDNTITVSKISPPHEKTSKKK